jgi:predicted Zn-dependent protease
MTAIKGEFFAPGSAVAEPAQYHWHKHTVTLDSGIKLICRVDEIQQQQCFFTDGSSFIGAHALPDALLKSQQPIKQRIAILEQATPKNILFLLTAFVVLLLIIRTSLTSATPFVVSLIPHSIEAKVGQLGYEQITTRYFLPSRLPVDKRLAIIAKYKTLLTQAELSHNPELFFHDAPDIGANAMAFPGGPIVVTDALVNALGEPELVAAVLAHEIAHVHQRHSLQQAVIATSSLAIASVIFGAEEGFSEELLAAIVTLYAFQHSQDFELASDQYAVELLTKAGLAPSAMHDSLTILLQQSSPSTVDKWLSTHPDRTRRLAALVDSSTAD